MKFALFYEIPVARPYEALPVKTENLRIGYGVRPATLLSGP